MEDTSKPMLCHIMKKDYPKEILILFEQVADMTDELLHVAPQNN